MLLEALAALGFFAAAVPFGYLGRGVRHSPRTSTVKWTLFLALVHTPVVPLIVFVKVADVPIAFELLLVALVLAGHLTGVLTHRQLAGRRLDARAPAAAAGDR